MDSAINLVTPPDENGSPIDLVSPSLQPPPPPLYTSPYIAQPSSLSAAFADKLSPLRFSESMGEDEKPLSFGAVAGKAAALTSTPPGGSLGMVPSAAAAASAKPEIKRARLRNPIRLPGKQPPSLPQRTQANSLDEKTSFNDGTILDGQWIVFKALHPGAEGEVYLVRKFSGDGTMYVLKTSYMPVFRAQLNDEVAVYKKLDARMTNNRSRFPMLYMSGDFEANTGRRYGETFAYMVITYFTEPFMYKYVKTHARRETLKNNKVAFMLPQNKALKAIICQLEALQLLHSAGFVHHDSHGGNVVYVNEEYCKLIDFGRAKDVSQENVRLQDYQREVMTIFKGFFKSKPDANGNPEQFTDGQLRYLLTQSSEDLRLIDYVLALETFMGHINPPFQWPSIVEQETYKLLKPIHDMFHARIIEQAWLVEDAMEQCLLEIENLQ